MPDLNDITCVVQSVEEVCTKLTAFGVVRLPSFLSLQETGRIHQEAELATSATANYRNPYGPCSRFSLEELPAHLSRSRDLTNGAHLRRLPACFQLTRKVIGSQLFRKITQSYFGPHSGFMEVIAFTKDCYPDSDAVYGHMHFDRRHQLKFILYLNDVDESNGPFGCIPGSHQLGQTMFRDAWRKVLGLTGMDDIEVDRIAATVPEDQAEYLTLPCVSNHSGTLESPTMGRENLLVVGNAGTLVVFDSHIFHHGGLVKPPSERWTLKGHTFAIVN